MIFGSAWGAPTMNGYKPRKTQYSINNPENNTLNKNKDLSGSGSTDTGSTSLSLMTQSMVALSSEPTSFNITSLANAQNESFKNNGLSPDERKI